MKFLPPAYCHQILYLSIFFYSFSLETLVSLKRYFKILYYVSNAKGKQNSFKAVFLNLLFLGQEP